MENILTHKFLKFLFLLPIALMLASAVFFSKLFDANQKYLVNEKFQEKKLEIAMMANNTEKFIKQDNDWETQHAYYQQSLVFNMEELDTANMTYAMLFDANLNQLSVQTYYTGGFTPMVYPNFMTAVRSNEMGDLTFDFTPPDPKNGGERTVYLHYRWIPTGPQYKDRFLAVIAISTLSVVTQVDGWSKGGIVALISITAIVNMAMIIVITYGWCPDARKCLTRRWRTARQPNKKQIQR